MRCGLSKARTARRFSCPTVMPALTFHGRLLIVQRHQAGWRQAHIAKAMGDLAQVREDLGRPVRRRGRGRAARPVLATALDARPDRRRGRGRRSWQLRRRAAARARTGSAPELGVPARTVSRILRRHQRALPARVRPDDRGGDPRHQDHRGPLRTRPARRAGPHGRQEDRHASPTAAGGGPTAAAGQTAAEEGQDRLRLRALHGRRPLPAGLLRDPARREGRHLRRVPPARRGLLRRPRHHPHRARSSPTTTSATALSTTSRRRSPRSAPSTSSSSPTAPGRTARSNGSTAPWPPSGPTARSSPATPTEPPPLRPGSSTTTLNDATAHSEASHPSADCHQPDGRVHLGLAAA